MSDFDVLLQQLITGLSNGMIIALIALGYTMVYGIIELVNFAHGDVFMLSAFFALTVVGSSGIGEVSPWVSIPLLLLIVPLFSAGVNLLINKVAYKPLRNSPKLTSLVSAIGVSFILINIGLLWGGIPMDVFGGGTQAASPKAFPDLLSYENLLGEDSDIVITAKDLLVLAVTIPLLTGLTWFVQKTKYGRAMRAVAQNPNAACLMGIQSERVISHTFLVGGALAGVAGVIYSVYNNTIGFQMGFRVGIDAFTAAVLGGIGSLPGAVCGGLLIGFIRSLSDQYLQTQWTNVVVFVALIAVLLFRPNGIFGLATKEKV